jgi:AcrR family transcriptional regulator
LFDYSTLLGWGDFLDKDRNTETKQHLINAALKLFKVQGYEKVTINQICADVGIVKNTFYYYFESKEALLEASVGSFENLTMTSLSDILLSGESYFEQFWRIEKPFYDFVAKNGIDIVRNFEYIQLTKPEKRLETLQSVCELDKVRVTVIQKGQEAGEIRNTADPRALIMISLSQFFGILSLWAANNGAFDFNQTVRMGLEVCFDVRPDLRTVDVESVLQAQMRLRQNVDANTV